MQLCEKCGAQIQTNAVSCPSCGVECKHCSYCGTELPLNATICNSCGAPVISVATVKKICDASPAHESSAACFEEVPKKKPPLKFIFFVCISVTILILIIGSYSNPNKEKETTQQEGKDVTTTTASNANVQDNKSNSAGESFDEEDVKAMVSEYVNAMVFAINNGDFTKVQKFIKDNTQIYEQQKKLVSKLYSKSIKEEFLLGTIETKYNSTKNIIQADIYEKHKIIYPSGKIEYVDNFYIYDITDLKPYKILKISAGRNPYANSETLGVITGNNVNLRLTPARDSQVLAQAMKNDSIKICGTEEVGGEIWVKIKHKKSGLAWAHGDYISQ